MAISSIIKTINRVIPFADASRPLWQDAIYSLLLCTFLYFAPQLSLTQLRTTIATKLQCWKHGRQIWPVHEQHDTPGNAQDTDTEQHRRAPPAPTVEDDSGSDDSDLADDEELAALLRDVERHQAHINVNANINPDDAVPRPGPAHRVEQLQPEHAPLNQPRRLRDPNRQVGAKKAKSLARRERVRAYHEFLREQGDMQRAHDASTAAERERELAQQRARRAQVEAEIEERARRRREERRVWEEERQRVEREAVERAVGMVERGLLASGRVEVRAVAAAVGRDRVWVEQLVRRQGLLEMRSDEQGQVVVMLTSRGWIVRVTEHDLRQLELQASSYSGQVPGKISWIEMSTLLDEVLRKQHRIQ